jgi:vacuolar-type H+-ATPase subunit E/Vma4
MDDAAGLSAQLDPLAAALMAMARSDAQSRLTEARAKVASIREDADAAAKRVLAKAAAEGEAAAQREGAHRLVEAKRRARGRVLQAERAAYDRLFDVALKAVLEVREQPECQVLEDRLARLAAGALGRGATVERDPQGQGGVLARSDGRCVDLTLPVLVRRCISRMGKEVSRLWA